MTDLAKLDIKYQSDSAGVYLSYLPEEQFKNTKLLQIMNLDRLDANNRTNPNGQFDYVDGYTISKGRIIFPVVEPFGSHLRTYLNSPTLADKYCFDALYDSTKTVAKQIAEKKSLIEDCKAKLIPIFDELKNFYAKQGIKVIKKV